MAWGLHAWLKEGCMVLGAGGECSPGLLPVCSTWFAPRVHARGTSRHKLAAQAVHISHHDSAQLRLSRHPRSPSPTSEPPCARWASSSRTRRASRRQTATSHRRRRQRRRRCGRLRSCLQLPVCTPHKLLLLRCCCWGTSRHAQCCRPSGCDPYECMTDAVTCLLRWPAGCRRQCL